MKHKDHASDVVKPIEGTSNDQKICNYVMHKHFSKVSAAGLGPIDTNRKLPLFVALVLNGLEFQTKRNFQQTDHGFSVVGELDEVVPCHSRFYGFEGEIDVQIFGTAFGVVSTTGQELQR